MGLYTRLLKEREEEERHKGSTPSTFRNVDSPALKRRLADAPEYSPRYVADLQRLYRYVRRGPTNAGTGMRYRALRQKYVKEYDELMGESQGQAELL
jgi:hypothetical protein